MLVDGRVIASEIIEGLKKERATLMRPPHLGIVVGADDPVTSAYVRLKERMAVQLGVDVRKEMLAADTPTERAVVIVQDAIRQNDAVVVQLPLPKGMDAARVLSALPPKYDVDALNPTTKEVERIVHAPVAEAIHEIIKRYNVNMRDQKAVVVGAGALVGIPAADLLRRLGANVTIVTLEKGSLEELKDADIVVLGAGSPGLIKPEMLKHGVVLIDAGTSEQGGKAVGDADPSCADIAAIFTPVPGGVGPVSVAMLFKNLFTLVSTH